MPPPGHEPAAEHAFPPSLSSLPVANDVAAVVALVGHHDHDRVAGHVIEAVDDGAAEAVRSGVLHGRQRRHVASPVVAGSSHVASVLPSSTTTISWGTPLSRSSRCRCSTVEAMQPSSSRAGITTLSLVSAGRAGLGRCSIAMLIVRTIPA